LKILFIHTYYKYRGGEDTVVEKEQELMQLSGCKVESLNFKNDKFTFLKFLLAPFNPFSFYRVYKKINRFKPDIVHLHNWSFAASPSVIWAVKFKEIPIVHTLHNFRIICPSATLSHNQKLYMASVNSSFPWKSIWKRVYKSSIFFTFWMTLCTRFNYFIGTWRKVDCFIALTNNSKIIFEQSYLRVNRSKIIAKPNFVNDPYLAVNAEDRSDHFLYIGRLSEEKGVSTLLGAFLNSRYKLRIIGDGPLKPMVESFTKENRNITYLGYKEKSEIEKELSKCNALIFPSVCLETFGMSIIEAFSTGTPVIATNIGSAKDLVKDGVNGLHFTSGDEEDLKCQLEKWSTLDKNEKLFFYKNALEAYKKNFTPEKNFLQLSIIYSSLKENKKLSCFEK
jgi:glycosyltransferase involved in cell wall biosynthesis